MVCLVSRCAITSNSTSKSITKQMIKSTLPHSPYSLLLKLTYCLIIILVFNAGTGMPIKLPTLPNFPVSKYRDDKTNGTAVYMNESIDLYNQELFYATSGRLFDIVSPNTLLIDLVGLISDDPQSLAMDRTLVTNSTHELMVLFMSRVLKTVGESVGNYSGYNSLSLSFIIQVEKDLDFKQCGIKTTLPIELSNRFTNVEVFVSIRSSHNVIDCGEEYLFNFIHTSPWSFKITNSILSQVKLNGDHIFDRVDFRDGCTLLDPLNVFFIKTKTTGLPLSICSLLLSRLVFIDSIIDNLKIHNSLDLETIIISKSTVELSISYGVKNAWLFESTIISKEFLLSGLDQFVMCNTKFVLWNDSNFIDFQVTFTKEVFIENYENYIVPVPMRIEHCVNVVLKRVQILSVDYMETILFFRGIKSLYMDSSNFVGNNAKKLIEFEYIILLEMSNTNFEKNTATQSPITLSGKITDAKAYIKKSRFIRNKAGEKSVISVLDNRIIIEVCMFEENEGINGGGMYIESYFSIQFSSFTRNRASKNGGSLYIYGSGALSGSQFTGNQVTSTVITSCGNSECDGSGGAIFYKHEREIFLSYCIFEHNSAIRGGALFIESEGQPTLQSLVFSNNHAKYGGGSVFFQSGMVHPEIKSYLNVGNGADSFGNEYASALSSVQWRVEKEISSEGEKVKILSESGNKILVYPGQLFSLIPVFSDLFNNSISDRRESFQVKIMNSRFTIIQSSNEDFKNFFISSLDPIITNENVSMVISFPKVESNFTIILQSCPKGYFLKDSQFNKNHVCIYEESKEYLIAVAVSVTIVVISLLLCSIAGISMFCFKVSVKIKYWMRRDRAEKDIEKRLLDNELNPEEGEMSEVKSLNFVISIDQITLERKIGEGGSGVVFLGKWHHHPVAVKCLRLTEGYQNSDEIEKEASLLCKLRHPNIVLFFGVSITPQKQYLIVEYLEKGSLEKHINLMKRSHFCSFVDKLKLLTDITCGMLYLHSLKVIHRDLKPGNILLDSMGVAKVCDFGISKMVGNTISSTTVCAGTITYMAPELLQSDSGKNRITTSVDVYSFSIIMYELFFEESPYSKSSKLNLKQDLDVKRNDHLVTPFSVISKVIKGERPEIPFNNSTQTSEWLEMYWPEFHTFSDTCQLTAISIVNDYVELMKACWNHEAEHRPNFETIFNCLSLLRQQFIDLTDYQKQLSESLSSTTSFN